ncbi:MAG TPA: AAA family ATPase [Stellaceae bacterium]|jgi:putative DNA primase/helicase|nr:AAA family ATPase [Stellaceae bacterium]
MLNNDDNINQKIDDDLRHAFRDDFDFEHDDFAPPEDEPKREAPVKSMFRTRQHDKAAPPPKYMIEGLLQEDTHNALYAPKSFLKSFLALDLSYAIATALKAFGSLPVIEPGPVVYFAGEGHDDVVKNRSCAWEIAHEFLPYEVDNIIFAHGAPYVNQPAVVDQAIADIKGWLGAGRKAKLTVIDTLNRALNGEDEDRAHTASKYLNMLKRITDEIGGATLTVAHLGKDTSRGGRGTSAFEAGFDTVMYITEHAHDLDSDEHVITVEVRYQKVGPDGAKYRLKSRQVKTDDGYSLVLEPCTETEMAQVAKAATTGKIDRNTILDALTEMGRGHGGYVTTGKLAEYLADKYGKKKDSVQRTLNRKRDEFAEFRVGVDGWALPLDASPMPVNHPGQNGLDMSRTN